MQSGDTAGGGEGCLLDTNGSFPMWVFGAGPQIKADTFPKGVCVSDDVGKYWPSHETENHILA